MTAVVRREHARATSLTGAAGMLLLAVAVVMMVVAAPAHGGTRPHVPARPSGVQFTSDVCHQLTSRSDSATVRACWAGPAAQGAWTGAF